MHQPLMPPDPPGADGGAPSAPPSRQTTEAGTHTGTGLRADAQRRQAVTG